MTLKTISISFDQLLSRCHIPNEALGTVVALGNFDGVHLGHRSLVDKARSAAEAQRCMLSVLTFEPHPRRVFRQDDPPFRLTPAVSKAEKLEELGVSVVFEVKFDWAVSALTYADFINKIIKPLQPRLVLAGEDFHFGHNRSGTLQHFREHGIKCEAIPLKTDPQHGVISSTRIRALMQSGHCQEANALLGWEWFISGTVQRGDQRGRELGYPTANVAIGEHIHPAYGVYVTQVKIDGYDQLYNAATNIGVRPMFELPMALIEAHILDFSDNIYGRCIKIYPKFKIRDEMFFETLDALKAQIQKDCLVVERWVQNNA